MLGDGDRPIQVLHKIMNSLARWKQRSEVVTHVTCLINKSIAEQKPGLLNTSAYRQRYNSILLAFPKMPIKMNGRESLE